jgi:ubiquinone/menaquinone biosynthesis C-methylase UbiE
VNLEFKQAPAEKIPLPDCSVDLIITAQAAHWFDLDAFFSESDRILKPEGCLAIWGYGNAQLSDCEDDAEAKRLFDDVRIDIRFISCHTQY